MYYYDYYYWQARVRVRYIYVYVWYGSEYVDDTYLPKYISIFEHLQLYWHLNEVDALDGVRCSHVFALYASKCPLGFTHLHKHPSAPTTRTLQTQFIWENLSTFAIARKTASVRIASTLKNIHTQTLGKKEEGKNSEHTHTHHRHHRPSHRHHRWWWPLYATNITHISTANIATKERSQFARMDYICCHICDAENHALLHNVARCGGHSFVAVGRLVTQRTQTLNVSLGPRFFFVAFFRCSFSQPSLLFHWKT